MDILSTIYLGRIQETCGTSLTWALADIAQSSLLSHILASTSLAKIEVTNFVIKVYGHKVIVQQNSTFFQQYQRQGEAICILQAPGLGENGPSVEEDDIVELRKLVYGVDGSLRGMQAWLAERKAIAVDKRLPDTRPSTSQQLPAPGWTNIIYSARVLKVLHSDERLILRVQGLPFVATSCIERFNIQLCSSERPRCIFFALQLVQQALLSRGLHGNTLLNGIDTGSTQQDKSRWMRSMLFPTPQDCEMQENLHLGGSQESSDLDLNREQRRAVNSIWSQDYGNLPFLISGPPGTGKTKTVIETVLQLVKKTTEHAHILLYQSLFLLVRPGIRIRGSSEKMSY